MKVLLARYAQVGRVDWIGVRGQRLAAPDALDAVGVTEAGLEGDHARAGPRAVTLIQAEHLAVVGAMLGRGPVAPAVLRRNLVISGINLSALRGRVLGIGSVQLRLIVPCAPCSRMEAALGHGGYTALRGHGGWCAQVVAGGWIGLGDRAVPLD